MCEGRCPSCVVGHGGGKAGRVSLLSSSHHLCPPTHSILTRAVGLSRQDHEQTDSEAWAWMRRWSRSERYVVEDVVMLTRSADLAVGDSVTDTKSRTCTPLLELVK